MAALSNSLRSSAESAARYWSILRSDSLSAYCDGFALHFHVDGPPGPRLQSRMMTGTLSPECRPAERSLHESTSPGSPPDSEKLADRRSFRNASNTASFASITSAECSRTSRTAADGVTPRSTSRFSRSDSRANDRPRFVPAQHGRKRLPTRHAATCETALSAAAASSSRPAPIPQSPDSSVVSIGPRHIVGSGQHARRRRPAACIAGHCRNETSCRESGTFAWRPPTSGRGRNPGRAV